MKNTSTLRLAKGTFLFSFIIGNICLFGHLIFRHSGFDIAGFFWLYIATAINIAVLISLLVYGLFRKDLMPICVKSAGILLINIPIAFLYAYIGLEII